ncbi:response regulator [Devosia sp. D6-9]|nr:response regulator [Devosia sp. D6-9]
MKVVAVLAANPALSSILTMVLAGCPSLRVRLFESRAALTTYMRLAPVDVVVADFDCDDAPADQLAAALRQDEHLHRRDFSIIALTRTVTDTTRNAAVSAGIDEVIVKPMSPRYLLERVLARTRRQDHPVRSAAYHGPERRHRLTLPPAGVYARKSDNVIPLFGRPRQQELH